MKGLKNLPQPEDLSRAYDALENQLPECTPSNLALWSQWARYDARLAEICVRYVAEHWREMDPDVLREELLRQPWPAAMAVLLEYVPAVLSRQKKEGATANFKHWSNAATSGLEHGRDELFFMGMRSVGGKAMREDAEFSRRAYLKWGYLGRESLLSKPTWSGGTDLSAPRRRTILIQLMKLNRSFTAMDYVLACDRGVSLRQAERDLRACDKLRTHGQTRARRYVVA